MNQYWLTLSQNTFLWLKNNECLFYNTTNFQFEHLYINERLQCIILTLLDINNLYRVQLTEEDLMISEIREFINMIISSKSGSLIPNDGINKRPVSLKPELKVQDDIQYYKWKNKFNIDGDIMNNLHGVSFFINGSKYGDLNYSNQIQYPIKSDSILSKYKIYTFLYNTRNSYAISEISLIGDLWSYPDYSAFISDLSLFNYSINIYSTEMDVFAHLDDISEDMNIYSINILIRDILILDKIIKKGNNVKNIFFFTFIITSEIEYKEALDYIDKHDLQRANFLPVYTGSNYSFWETNIYLTEDEIGSFQLFKRNIFAKQILNVNFFGKLFIFPDETVYSNLNHKSIGSINEAPHDIIYREITEGKSWFYIRNQKPCCDCVYQWLCPSPSNYELVIGKPNLCHIKP